MDTDLLATAAEILKKSTATAVILNTVVSASAGMKFFRKAHTVTVSHVTPSQAHLPTQPVSLTTFVDATEDILDSLPLSPWIWASVIFPLQRLSIIIH